MDSNDEDGMENDDDKAAGRKARRPTGAGSPVIDLQATEVASEPAPTTDEPAAAPETAAAGPADPAPAEAATPPGQGPWAGAEDSRGTSTPETPASDAGTPEPPKPGPEAPRVPPLDVFAERQPRPSRLPLALAALAGGVVGGALVLAAMFAGLVPGGGAPQDETLAPRLAAIEQELASGRQALDRTAGRVAAVETAVKGASDSASNAINLAEEAKVAAANVPAAAPSGAPVDLAPLGKRLDDTDKAVADLRAAVDPLGQKVTAAADAATQTRAGIEVVQQRLGALEQAASGSRERSAAYLVALSQLGEALRAGRPFEPELQAASALAGDARPLDALTPLADRGAPSLDGLTQAFDALAPSLVSTLAPKPASAPAAAEPSALDRLWTSFGSVVSVTRDDQPDALAAAQPVKAVSDALHRGDLAAALDAFAAMPEAARTAGAAWATEAKARLDADALVRSQSAAALKTLSGK